MKHRLDEILKIENKQKYFNLTGKKQNKKKTIFDEKYYKNVIIKTTHCYCLYE